VIGSADVLATAVFALPRSVVGEKLVKGVPCPNTYVEFQKTRKWNAQSCSDELQGILKSADAAAQNADKEAGRFDEMVKQISNSSTVNTKIKDLVAKENFALVLLMNILRLDDLMWLKSVGNDWQSFLVGGLGSVIMAAAISIVYFMLFIAFLVRVVILWIMIPLMPLGVLGMALKDIIPGMEGGGDETFSLKGFIKTAMMPVFVAFPLAIAMIMIFGNNSISTLDGVSMVSFDALGKHFNVILWWAASVGVLWFGTKKAIEMGNTYAAKATDAIHNKVNGAVSAVAGTAKYIPIIPSLSGEGGTSANEMLGAPMAALHKVKSASDSRKNAQGVAMAKNLLPDSWTAEATMTQEELTDSFRSAISSDAGKTGKEKGSSLTSQVENLARRDDVSAMEKEIGKEISDSIQNTYGISVSQNKSYIEALEEIASSSKLDSAQRGKLTAAINEIKIKLEQTPTPTPEAAETATPDLATLKSNAATASNSTDIATLNVNLKAATENLGEAEKKEFVENVYGEMKASSSMQAELKKLLTEEAKNNDLSKSILEIITDTEK
jgi:DNA-binding transcriptional regulator GbsR (MarR family)